MEHPTCSLAEHCSREVYAAGLCEAHYRRKMRGSKKWDRPLNRRGDLVMVAGRVPKAVRVALMDALAPGQSLYSKVAEILEQWSQGRKERDA